MRGKVTFVNEKCHDTPCRISKEEKRQTGHLNVLGKTGHLHLLKGINSPVRKSLLGEQKKDRPIGRP
jgi:hypothetical protein